MRWTSGFPEITETWSADAFEKNCSTCNFYHSYKYLLLKTEHTTTRPTRWLLDFWMFRFIRCLAYNSNACGISSDITFKWKFMQKIMLGFVVTMGWSISHLYHIYNLGHLFLINWCCFILKGKVWKQAWHTGIVITVSYSVFVPSDFQRKQLTLSPDSEGSSRYTKELEGKMFSPYKDNVALF